MISSYTLLYLKILQEDTEDTYKIIKYNNLPKNKNIDITNILYHNHKIEQIILQDHCINSNDDIPHGLNYIDLPIEKFYIAFEQIISDIFKKQYDIKFNLYNTKIIRFQNFITTKSNNKTFKFIIQCSASENINSFKIEGITIFNSNKISKFGNFSSSGKYIGLQPILSNIYLETINFEPIMLSEIILD